MFAHPTVMDSDKFDQLLENVKNLKDKEASKMSLRNTFRTFEERGETVRGTYLGIKKILVNDPKNEGQKIYVDAVGWLEEDGKIYLNRGVNLMGQMASLEVFSDVEISYAGKDGNVKLYDVRPLKDKSA